MEGNTAGKEGDRRSKEDEEDGEERRLDVVSINRRLQAAGWTPIRGPDRGSVSRSGTSRQEVEGTTERGREYSREQSLLGPKWTVTPLPLPRNQPIRRRETC